MIGRGVGAHGFGRWAACAIMLVAGACEGVGSSLVDSQSADGSTAGAGACRPAPACDGEQPAELPAKLEPPAIDFEACGASPQPCAGEPERATLDSASPCRRPTELARWVAAGGALEPCATYRITNLEASDATEVSLDDVQWMHADVAIETVTPISITLRGATLDDVFLRLEGPVQLRVQGSAQFDAVRITSAPPAAQAAPAAAPPSIELERVDARELWIDGAPRFAGEVRVAHGRIAGGQVTAERLTAESTRLGSLQLRAGAWTATDIVMTDSQLAIERGLVSVSRFAASDVLGCGALTFIACSLDRMRLSACDEHVRVYDSVIVQGDFAGEIESDRSRWMSSQLGAREPTRIALWQTRVEAVAFCAGVHALTAGAGSSIDCSSCEGELAQAPTDELACAISSGTGLPEATASRCACPSFVDLPLCAEPIPERTRRLSVQ